MDDDNKATATAISIEVIGMVAEALKALQASMAQTHRSETLVASGGIEIEAEVAIAAKSETGIESSASLVTTPTPKVAAPWDDLNGVLPKGLNLKIDPELYVQMTWLTHNVPKMSLQKIVMNGTRAEVERLLALHYKP